MLEKKEQQNKKAVLVGLITQHQDEEKLTEYLDELEFLAYTAGATVEKRFTQKLSQPDSRTFVGSGKAQDRACRSRPRCDRSHARRWRGQRRTL